MVAKRETAAEYQKKKREERWLDNIRRKRQTMSADALVSLAGTYRKQGNDKFRAGNALEALDYYLSAAEYLRGVGSATRLPEPQRSLMQELLPILHSNSAQCYLKLEQWTDAIREATLAIENDSKSSKTYYRRAIGHAEIGNIEAALADLAMVKRLVPPAHWRESPAKTLRQKLRGVGGRLVLPTGRQPVDGHCSGAGKTLPGPEGQRAARGATMNRGKDAPEVPPDKSEQTRDLHREMLAAVSGTHIETNKQLEAYVNNIAEDNLKAHDRRKTIIERKIREDEKAAVIQQHLPSQLDTNGEGSFSSSTVDVWKLVVHRISEQLIGKSVLIDSGRVTCVDVLDFEGEAYVLIYLAKNRSFYDFDFTVVWELCDSANIMRPSTAEELISSSPPWLPPPKTDISGAFGRGTFVVHVSSESEPVMRIDQRNVEHGNDDHSAELEAIVTHAVAELEMAR
ncbi:peptidyl-prolyl cis-trans isomerase cpr6 [Perkinsus chesapeaki]|uniref:Peptidyl-prolyl cis-trans isomerase cpr6 n=1 Tax=Perkinsus chesapeaki TaxID=330153 RepID=A0A7J6MXD5_PERCH|nr:peptidyl-prolyl cis-trans isomerase cpr6 [Perkinsus chesapeaki]